MKKFRRILSIVLSILMVASVAAFSASAAEPAAEIPAGTQILFDNTATKWANVYIYGWQYGFAGEFLEMQETTTPGIYAYTLPEAVPVGSEFCLFVNKNSWAGATQTKNAAFPSADKNTVVPDATTASPLDISWTYTTPPAEAPYVSATPSKTFGREMDVVLYTNCATATYSLNGADPVPFENGDIVHITATGATLAAPVVSTFVLVGIPAEGDPVVGTYTYTGVGATTINATCDNYSGDVYAYLFGGDRIGAAFYLMTKNADGSYTYQFDGSAQVIFTTTNDWSTAVKLNTDEPLVAAGTTASFELHKPA